jgi:hypothetical protein
MRGGRVVRWAMAASAAVALALAGCGGGSEPKTASTDKPTSSPDETVDTAPIETKLKSSLSSSTQSGPKVTTVTCPTSVPAKEGSSFVCQASGGQGLKGNVTVTLKDAEGKEYSYKGTLKATGFTETVSGTAK